MPVIAPPFPLPRAADRHVKPAVTPATKMPDVFYATASTATIATRPIVAPLIHARASSSARSPAEHPPQAQAKLRVLHNKLRCLHYEPARGGDANGLIVLAPGGAGGMGPGQFELDPSPAFSAGKASLYSVLARRLAEANFAVCHFAWRRDFPSRIEGSTPRTPGRLRECALDVAAAVQSLRAAHDHHGPLPVVLVGYSTEACAAVMAAAALSLDNTGYTRGGEAARDLGPIAGVLCLSGGVRTNDAVHDYGGIDTIGCLETFKANNLPVLMMHGLNDNTIEPEATALAYESARGPAAAYFVRGADHTLTSRFDAVLTQLLRWVPSLFRRFGVLGDAGAQSGRLVGRGPGEPGAGVGEGGAVIIWFFLRVADKLAINQKVPGTTPRSPSARR